MDDLALLQKTNRIFLENYLVKNDKIGAKKNDSIVSALKCKYEQFELDIVPNRLNENSQKIKIPDTDSFICSQFEKYEDFFKQAFFANDSECGICSDIFNAYKNDYSYLLDVLQELGGYDKYLFFHQILNLYPSKETNFIIKDEKLLKIFSDGLAGDYIYSQIFFLKYPITICQGYDLSLPIFFKNKKDITMYEKIANECGLFLRQEFSMLDY